MSVTVVVVHWNQPERLRETLARLVEQGVEVRAVVVDNDSRPEAQPVLRRVVAEAPVPAVLVRMEHNTGFGPAANAGLRHWLDTGEGEWAAVVPHDALAEPGALRALVEAMRARPRAGLVCADVGDGETPVVDPYFGGMTKPAEVAEGWEPAHYPHGTLMLVRRSCLDEVGLFDERYFAYCEEADLGLRARDAGWEVGLLRGVRVVNPTMRSGSPVTDYLMLRNTLLLVREHSGRYHAGIRFVIAAMQLTRGVVQPSSRPWLFSAEGRVWGMLDFLRGHYGPPPEHLLREARPQS
ncbi:MAG: glycosyltransferase family 2 protein [Acidimicrobiales bacterium]|nr:glycosyltransferase family 2 protein [Acidimicrobiales bacterium]